MFDHYSHLDNTYIMKDRSLSDQISNAESKIYNNLKKISTEITLPKTKKGQCKFGLSNFPSMISFFIKDEFKIPLNINDVLLIGFSLLPAIGWIFDIFMILRALIEKRYIYAILMTINCYQYLFYKLISFGLLGYNLGPIIKLFYLAPYALDTFNYDNIKIKIDSWLNDINLNVRRSLDY